MNFRMIVPGTLEWVRKASPARRIAGIATLVLGTVVLLLLIVQLGGRLLKQPAPPLTAWTYFLGFLFILFFSFFGLGWLRRKLMWRLRNRLIVTYVFIGVIPVVLLVLMGVITAYLLGGQFATYVVTSDIQAELKAVQAANNVIAHALAGRVAAGTSPDKALGMMQPASTPAARRAGMWSLLAGQDITVWEQPPAGEARAFSLPKGRDVPLPPEKAGVAGGRALTVQSDGLYLRTWTTVPAGHARLTVILSERAGQALLERIAAGLGEVTVYSPEASITVRVNSKGTRVEKSEAPIIVEQGGKRVEIRNPAAKGVDPRLTGVTAGRLTSPLNRWDKEVLFGTPLQVMKWSNGDSATALLRVRTRPSQLYRRLFVALGEFANFILFALAAIAIVFALIELVALITGIRLTRTMTRSVAALYAATEQINAGDFAHRIPVTRHDQMASLETSFNSMAESLQKLLHEQKEKQRMESELAIAKEVQAQLFPRGVIQLKTLEVHGLCRPARTVSGDYYDFLQLGPEVLGLAVGDISGKGISAALMMATVHSAVRVYEFGRMATPFSALQNPRQASEMAAAAGQSLAVSGRASVVAGAGETQSPAAALNMLNRHLVHSTPPEKFATLFLGVWDGEKRTLRYANAGHISPFIVRQDSSVRKLAAGDLVLGVLDNVEYQEMSVELRAGEIVVAYSDGVTEPENEFGEFGEQRLIEMIQQNRHLPLASLSDVVADAVADWIGPKEQPDDITLVLARAR
ncbi:MAG: PP2C family protein-serine/threonine phosphatase [Terriglobales bacterium]